MRTVVQIITVQMCLNVVFHLKKIAVLSMLVESLRKIAEKPR